jgi:acyl-CoA thioesterase YciA
LAELRKIDMSEKNINPQGQLQLRTLAMPADTNPEGDIFGGWLLAQMDIAGGLPAKQLASGRVATVAVNSMVFHLPVFVGDVVCCYADIVKIGRTSVTVNVQAWVLRNASTSKGDGTREMVTEGTFVYVAVGADRKPRPITE